MKQAKLEEVIERLENRIESLERYNKYLLEEIARFERRIDERIDAHIENRVRVVVVENLEAYEKGEKIRKALKGII